MADIAKLKKKAAEFELKKQFDKALATYVEILQSYGRRTTEEVDLALYNRVGDLFLKQGNVADAVDYYEQAVDRYTEGGFFNNAIALCNKILRNSPGRASVYYKLGKISAHKGFKGDAKANFLEYADRMQRDGKIDESFRALKEFADLCPDQDDIRLMLADQLTRKGRGAEAVEQLQLLHARYVQEGRNTEARATIERMKAIDPNSQPLESGQATRRAPGDLVFLDLDDSTPPARGATPAAPPRAVAPPPKPEAEPPKTAPARPAMDAAARRATAGLDIIATGEHDEVPAAKAAAAPRAPAPAPPPAPEPEIFYEPEPVAEPEPELEPAIELEAVELEMYEPEVLDGMTRAVDFDAPADLGGSSSLLDGLQTSGFDLPDDGSSGSLLDLEPTSFAEPEPPPAPAPRPAPRPAAPPPAAARPAAPPPAAPRPAAPRPASPPPAAPRAAAPRPAAPEPLGGELLDFEMPDQRATGPREVAPREVRRPAAPPAASRPSFDDLPMLDDGPAQDADEAPSGGDLEFIMPDADEGADDALTDIPLMDLELPVAGEASARISGSPLPGIGADDLEMIDLSAPSQYEAPSYDRHAAPGEPVADELTPAELDVRAELDLDVPPIARQPAFEAVEEPLATTDSGSYDEIPEEPLPSATMNAAYSVEMLQAEVEINPEDFVLRQRLGEAMLESGDREGGLRELEAAMIGFERSDDLSSAASLADEIVRLNPGSVRHHQKRVEYAFRTNERGRLIEAYLQLADALFKVNQLEKSRAIYQRVLDLSPDDLRANAALESFPAEEAAPAPAAPAKGRPAAAGPRPAAPLKPIVTGDDDFVNLGDWLREDDAPKDTRMVVEEKEPTGDEEADFQDMLRKFKQGIAENVEEEDHQSHYDLGVAYKEMGLLDEAIAEFQKALKGPGNRVSTYEALGQCFIEKEQYPMAATILGRAVAEKGVSDDQLVGVLYLLGVAAEQRGQMELASQFYQRVFVVDIQFRDVGDRLAAVESAL